MSLGLKMMALKCSLTYTLQKLINLILSNTVILIAYVILEPFGFWNWGVLNYLRRPLSNPEFGADGGEGEPLGTP